MQLEAEILNMISQGLELEDIPHLCRRLYSLDFRMHHNFISDFITDLNRVGRNMIETRENRKASAEARKRFLASDSPLAEHHRQLQEKPNDSQPRLRGTTPTGQTEQPTAKSIVEAFAAGTRHD